VAAANPWHEMQRDQTQNQPHRVFRPSRDGSIIEANTQFNNGLWKFITHLLAPEAQIAKRCSFSTLRKDLMVRSRHCRGLTASWSLGVTDPTKQLCVTPRQHRSQATLQTIVVAGSCRAQGSLTLALGDVLRLRTFSELTQTLGCSTATLVKEIYKTFF
jgi:hypothetical protein